MNATLNAVVQRAETLVGGLACAAFGAADLWHFAKLAQTTDLVFVTIGLGVVTGVNVAKMIGGAAATAAAAATVTATDAAK